VRIVEAKTSSNTTITSAKPATMSNADVTVGHLRNARIAP
jgi:hypothetical protein